MSFIDPHIPTKKRKFKPNLVQICDNQQPPKKKIKYNLIDLTLDEENNDVTNIRISNVMPALEVEAIIIINHHLMTIIIIVYQWNLMKKKTVKK